MKTVQGYDSIKIKGSYPIKQLNGMQIVQEINNHFTLHLSGILPEREAENFIHTVCQKDTIEVTIQEDSEIVIFSGVPTAINVKSVHGINYIDLDFKSCTYDMDVTHYSRSFQDKKMTFDQLIKFIIKGYEDGDFINKGASEKAIEKIRVQYKETDWDFLKRMASSEGTILVPDIAVPKLRFWFGMPQSKKTIETSTEGYFSLKQKSATTDETEGFCYEVELQEYLNIGDTVIVNKIPFVVTKTLIQMKNGILLFTYRLQNSDSIKIKPIVNKRLQGISLPGKVIAVARNQLKVHLNIDPKQDVEKAYWFPYSAEANNVWYNMPHKGTNINIYFPGTEAALAMAMTSTRGGGAEMQKNPNMSKPTEKVMETKWGKELRLKEDHINIDTGLMNVKLDEKSIEVVSNDKIVIGTDTDLNLGKTITKAVIDGKETEIIKETKNISIITDELTTFKVSNTKSTIELEINNNLAGQIKVNMDGAIKAPMPTIASAGQQQKKQAEEAEKAEEDRQNALKERKKIGWGKILGAAALGLAAVAAFAAFTVLTGGTGPLIAAGIGASLGCSAAALSIGSAAVTVATVVTGITVVGLAGAATAEALEGTNDIRLANKGDLETTAFNPMRDGLLGGNEELYTASKEGLMVLATIETAGVAPFMGYNQTAAQANQRNMRTFQIPNPANLFGPQYNGNGTLAYSPPIVVSVPTINISGVAISTEQMIQLNMVQSGNGGGSGGGQGGNNTPDYIKDNRVPLDKETALNGKEYQKTKIKVKGAQVYKKDDKYYYRDTLHKGEASHLEVFDKRGNHIGEANPQTGQLIPGTADPTKKINVK